MDTRLLIATPQAGSASSGSRIRSAAWLALLVAAAPLTSHPATALGAQTVACEAGSPHPEAPPELEQFAFLLGRWDIKARRATEDGWTEQYGEAYWEGEYILDGFAIADYWYDTPPFGEGPATERGVNVRMYDPEAEIWRMSWHHTRLPGVRLLEAEKVGDEMVMWQLDRDGTRSPARRVTFYVTGPDSWHRIDERSQDGGETWTPALKLEATRRPCG